MPMHKVNRLVVENVKRPSWLPKDWKFETKVSTNGTSAGAVDNYYCEPVSGKKFRSMPEVLRFLKTGSTSKKSTGGDATPSETPNSKKLKKSSLKKEKDKTTSFYSDSLNPPQSVCWVLADSSTDTWAPFVHGNMVPEGQKREWDAVFSTVSQRNANRDAGVSNHRDLIVVDGFLVWRRNSQKVLHLNSVHDVQVILSQARAMEAVIACIGVGCLYCTILGVAPEE
ncbi:Methyl-CpG-binding domain protein 2 [Capsicum chinense]|nr:Methyl-CpG-binding domain protein 2 [Capsicum chinense]